MARIVCKRHLQPMPLVSCHSCHTPNVSGIYSICSLCHLCHATCVTLRMFKRCKVKVERWEHIGLFSRKSLFWRVRFSGRTKTTWKSPPDQNVRVVGPTGIQSEIKDPKIASFIRRGRRRGRGFWLLLLVCLLFLLLLLLLLLLFLLLLLRPPRPLLFCMYMCTSTIRIGRYL